MPKRGPDGRFTSNIEILKEIQRAKELKNWPADKAKYSSVSKAQAYAVSVQASEIYDGGVGRDVSNMLEKQAQYTEAYSGAPTATPVKPAAPAKIVVPTDPKEKLNFHYEELAKIWASGSAGFGLRVPLLEAEKKFMWNGSSGILDIRDNMLVAAFNGCSSYTLSGYGDITLTVNSYCKRYAWLLERQIDTETLVDFLCAKKLGTYSTIFMMMAPGLALTNLLKRKPLVCAKFFNPQHFDRRQQGEEGKSQLLAVTGGLLCGKFVDHVHAIKKFPSEIEIGSK